MRTRSLLLFSRSGRFAIFYDRYIFATVKYVRLVRKVRSPGKALLGKRPMTRVGRAVEKGETQGFMRILVDVETKEILGASLLGVECNEVIHSNLNVIYAKAPYTVIQRAMHIHHTVTELIPTMLGKLEPLQA